MSNRRPPLKSDRALELHEKGIPNDAIAERLGLEVRDVARVVCLARDRRKRKAARHQKPDQLQFEFVKNE